MVMIIITFCSPSPPGHNTSYIGTSTAIPLRADNRPVVGRSGGQSMPMPVHLTQIVPEISASALDLNFNSHIHWT